jgi:hypothetical protein
MMDAGDTIGRRGTFIENKRSIAFGKLKTLFKYSMLLPVSQDLISVFVRSRFLYSGYFIFINSFGLPGKKRAKL